MVARQPCKAGCWSCATELAQLVHDPLIIPLMEMQHLKELMDSDTLVKLSGSAAILLILLRLDTFLRLMKSLWQGILRLKITTRQKRVGVLLLLTAYFSSVGFSQSDLVGVCIAILGIIFLL